MFASFLTSGGFRGGYAVAATVRQWAQVALVPGSLRVRSYAPGATPAVALTTAVSVCGPFTETEEIEIPGSGAVSVGVVPFSKPVPVRVTVTALAPAPIVAGEGAGPCLDEDEVVTMAALILAAGFETTTALLCNGLVALIDAPEQATLLRARPELVKSAVEELLRYDTPVQMLIGRTAVEDMVVGELEVSAGQRFITIVGAANRDPLQFSEPDELRLDRDEGRPLSFGGGIHHCLGAALTRLEAQVMIPRLVERFPNARVSGVPVRRNGLLIRGYTSLPIELAG